MADNLTIILANLPEEGKSYQGELDASVLDTTEIDLVKPHSPLFYDVHVQRFDDELLVQGLLETTLSMQCVYTSRTFTQTLTIQEFASSVEIQSGAVDLTEIFREEIFIEAPVSPNCENADEKHEYELNSKYLAVDKPTDPGVNEPPIAAEGNQWTNNWNALDSIKNFSDEQD